MSLPKSQQKKRVSIFCFVMLLVAFTIIYFQNGDPLINTVILLCTGFIIAVVMIVVGRKNKGVKKDA